MTETASATMYPSLKKGEVSAGTTIMAVAFPNGVVLGADCRTSTGSYAVSRNSDKITQLHDHIWCCRSGSAADTQALCDYVKHYLAQLSIETGRPPSVKTASYLMRKLIYENKSYLMAGVIVAGWDSVDGGSVYNISLGGTCMKMPYAFGGSGSVYVMGLLDALLTEESMSSAESVKEIVKKVISHAISRDGGSGGSIRLVTVTQNDNARDYIPGNRLLYGP